jgi:hypothetical protein
MGPWQGSSYTIGPILKPGVFWQEEKENESKE